MFTNAFAQSAGSSASGFSIGGFDLALNVVDSAFAMMIFPTLISCIWLAPVAVKKAEEYFASITK